MIYLPSYVDILSVTDTAYSDLYKKNTEQKQEQQPKNKVDTKSSDMQSNKPTSSTLFVEMNDTPKKEEKSKVRWTSKSWECSNVVTISLLYL